MDKQFEIRLGKRIKSLRHERSGLSQERFAYQAEIDRTYYASIEQGRHCPSVKICLKIASTLGISLSELFETL